MSGKNMSKIKPIISVGAMAKALNHSRARFYQLQGTVYPPPIYDIRTKRPFYDARLQRICHQIRETGIGWDGHYILFYSPRKITVTKTQENSKARLSRKSTSNEYQEFVATLNSMGLAVSEKQVATAMKEVYPLGYEDEDTGVVIRQLFRYLKHSL